MKGTLEPIIRPAHQHIPNIANNLSRRRLDLGPHIANPEARDGFPPRADLEPALACALEEQRHEIPVCVCAGAVVAWRCGDGRIDCEVVEESQDALCFRSRDVMGLDEILIWEAQASREADHEFLRDAVGLAHEVERCVFEAGEGTVGDPHALHVCAELELVGFFLVGHAGGGADLAVLFPAGVFVGEGDGGFRGVGESEEGGGGGEHVLYFGEADAVVDEAEEAICFGGVDELGGDLVDAVGEVMEGDFRDGAVCIFGCVCHCARVCGFVLPSRREVGFSILGLM